MGKKKKIIIVSSAIALILASGGVGAYFYLNQEEPPPPPVPIADKQVTIGEMKTEYNYVDNNISPLYNVGKTDEIIINFSSYLGDIPKSDIITVHTSSDLGVGSTVGIELIPESFDVGPSTFTIKPTEPILNTVKGTWGIHTTYYLQINYDLDTNVPTKLAKPIVVPFTIKGDAENVELTTEITTQGAFKIKYATNNTTPKIVALYNLIRGSETEFENAKKTLEQDKFVNTFARNIGTITQSDFNDWESKSLASGQVTLPTSTVAELNKGLNGAYYGVNVDGNTASIASNIINISEYASRIPMKVKTVLDGAEHETIRSLPKTVQVVMKDGSITDQSINYLTDGVVVEEGKPTSIPFEIANTTYKGTVLVLKMKQAELEVIDSGEIVNNVASYAKPINTTAVVPSIELTTLISENAIEVLEDGTETSENNEPTTAGEDTVSKEEPKEGETKTTNGSLGLGGTEQGEAEVEEEDPTAEMGIINKQYYFNKIAVETANEQTVTIPAYIQELGYEFVHSDALEKYLVYSILANQGSISIEAFPDAQNYNTITDVMEKVLTQNPLLQSVSEWKYDYATRTISLVYNSSFSQQDLIKRAQEILDTLIYEDKALSKKQIKNGETPKRVLKTLTEQEKYQLIYDYLVENVVPSTVYEEEVVEPEVNETVIEEPKDDAEATEPKESTEVVGIVNGEGVVDGGEALPVDTSTSTAYKALVDGVADDLGIAKAMKLLLDLSDVTSIIITGYYKSEPHAWNKVSLNDSWYNTDATFNMQTIGIPYALSLATDSSALNLGFVTSKDYWIDSQLGVFSSTATDLDYYLVNALEVNTIADYAKVLESQLQAGNRVSVIRTTLELDPKEIFDITGSVVQQTVPEHLSTATFNSKGKYYIVITHEEEVEEEPVEDGAPEDVTEGNEAEQKEAESNK